MSPKRRRLLWFSVAAVLVTAVGGFALWLARPTPYERAYDNIQLRMPEAAIEELVGPLPVTTVQVGPTIWFDWQGISDGQSKRVKGGKREEGNPAVQNSRLVSLKNTRTAEVTAPGRAVYRSPETGRPEYVLRRVGAGSEVISVLFDADGLAVEKVYTRMESQTPFAEAMRTVLQIVWPF